MTMPPPLPLNYQSPDPSHLKSPERKLFFRHALGGGIACILLSLCLGAGTAAVVNSPDLPTILVALALGLYALYFLIAGILYLAGAIASRNKPALGWILTVQIVSSIHAALVALFLLALILTTARAGNVVSIAVPILFNIALFAGLAKIASTASKLRKQTPAPTL